MSTFPATYFDGAVAADRAVHVETDGGSLIFSGPGVQFQNWQYSDLEAVDPPVTGSPLRLANAMHPGARLVITAEDAKANILHHAPHLRGGLSMARIVRLSGWIAAGLSIVAVAAYLVMQFLPQKVAFALPDRWRDRVGAAFEKSIAEQAKPCTSPAAQSAMGALLARLSEGNPDMPPISVNIYDLNVMNAFAVPGDRIVVTADLIKRASAPDEVAGVIAHELGHVVYRHPEAQLVRATGLQLLFAIMTGGNGNDALTSMAGLAAIMRYSRGAESDADAYAVKLLTDAEIDPQGLKRFFEIVLQEEAKHPSAGGAIGKIGSLFATHPGTADRINRIPPLPPGVTARPVMTGDQWKALQAACSS